MMVLIKGTPSTNGSPMYQQNSIREMCKSLYISQATVYRYIKVK